MITLSELQLIDNQLDELEELRGDLPLAVNELTNQINLMKTQIEEKEHEKVESIKKRNFNDSEIQRLQVLLKKFKSQLYQVRNNKEYDALTKEIDRSDDQIKKLEEENFELENSVDIIKNEIEEIKPKLNELIKDKTTKEKELKKIISLNEREEIKLQEERSEVVSKVRKSDYNTYMRIRKACGGIAIATVVRSACSGCHNVVPPQRQIEIRQNKRLFTCESCGRLLVSAEISEKAKTALS